MERGSRRNERGAYVGQYSFDVLLDLVIGEATKSFALLQVFLTRAIFIGLFLVDGAVDLDRETAFDAVEIDNETADGVLPSELRSRKAPTS